MSVFARTDTSLVGRWWWTIDRWSLAAIAGIAVMGVVLAMAASPSVAERIGLDAFHFAKRHFLFLGVGLLVMLGTSLLGVRSVRRLSVLVYLGAVAMMVATLFLGEEIKGATRWIRIAGFSLQASEFVKPAFAVLAAWMFAEWRRDPHFPGRVVATSLLAVTAGLLLLQPDVGMTIVVCAVWAAEFFVAGLPMLFVVALGAVFLVGAVGAYFAFDHVRLRIDHFLDPSAGNGYQVDRALQAFRDGGLMGRGPGEGRVKEVLPDAHADFVFAVAGEEFGLIVCLGLVALFAFVLIRGLARVFRDDDMFVMIAVTGLLAQFGLQAIINMASNIHLIPPKGMTLPFVSYGGSSMLAMALGMGMVLALTRERAGRGGAP